MPGTNGLLFLLIGAMIMLLGARVRAESDAFQITEKGE